MSELGAVAIVRKTGSEPFRDGSRDLPFKLLDFWQWSSSDLCGNVYRGVLAEYLVASALGLAHCTVRTEWDACDLRTPAGLRVEVKSAAYLQSWPQKRLSPIQFDVRSTWGWDSATDAYSDTQCRHADVYVFCLLAHRDKATLNPLDVSQWTFFVLPTHVLEQHVPLQKSLSLGSLQRLGAVALPYSQLASAITVAASPAEGKETSL